MALPKLKQSPYFASRTIPELKIRPDKGRNLDELSPEELQQIENELNHLKEDFFKNFGDPGVGAYEYQRLQREKLEPYLKAKYASARFEQNLEMFRSHFAEHALSESGWDLLFSALGPVGALLKTTRHKKISWEVAWQMNLLNPTAIFWYIKMLPELKAFRIIKDPIKKTIGLLAASQNPLFSSFHYQQPVWNPNTREWQTQTQSVYGFAPTIAFNAATGKLADRIDKFMYKGGVSEDFMHNALNASLKEYRAARASGDRNRIKLANAGIKNILNLRDSSLNGSGFRKNVLLHPLKRLSKNLRRTDEGILSFLAALIGNLIFDTTVGFVANVLKFIATKIINNIPLAAQMRASIARLFSSPAWRSNINMGRLTLAAETKALLSVNTLSGGFLGARLFSAISPQLTFAGGVLGGFAGWQYQALLNMAADETLMQFARYPDARAVRALGRLGAPGPLLRTAYWLNQNPWFRVPLSGMFVGTLLGPILESLYGISPATTFWTATAVNYFWATKGFWLGKVLTSSPVTNQLGKLVSRLNLPNNIVYEFSQKPFQTLWQIGYEASFRTPFNRFLFRQLLNDTFVGKSFRLAQSFANNPFVRRFFEGWLANPGTFMGLTLIPTLIGLGVPFWQALIGAPLLGGLGWNMASTLFSYIPGMSKALFSRLGWWGSIIGTLSSPFAANFGVSPGVWIGGWTILFPVVTGGFMLLGNFLVNIGFLTGVGEFLVTGTTGLLTLGLETLGITVAATPLAIIGVGAVAIVGVFVITAATWTPFDTGAAISNVSACFGLTSQTPSGLVQPGEAHRSCFTINNIQDPLIVQEPKIKCAVEVDLLGGWQLKNNFTPQVVNVNRQIPNQTPETLVYGEVEQFNNRYGIASFAAPYGGNNQPMVVDLSVFGKDDGAGKHLSGITIDELRELFPNLKITTNSLYALIEYLKSQPDPGLAKDYLVAEYEAQLAVVKKQQQIANDLSRDLKSFNNLLSSAETIDQNILNRAANLLTTYKSMAAPLSDLGQFDFPNAEISKASQDLGTCSTKYTNPETVSLCQEHFKKLVVNIYTPWNQPLTIPYDRIVVVNNNLNQQNLTSAKITLSQLIEMVTKLSEQSPDAIDSLNEAIKQLKDINANNLDELINQRVYFLPHSTNYEVCYDVVRNSDQPAAAAPAVKVECTAFQDFIGPFNQPYCQTRLAP